MSATGLVNPSTFDIKVGQTIQLNLQVVDANGNPAPLATGPNYSIDNATLATLAPNANGVAVTATAAGTVKVTMTGTNAAGATITAESDGTLAAPVPLAVAAFLVPGSVTG